MSLSDDDIVVDELKELVFQSNAKELDTVLRQGRSHVDSTNGDVLKETALYFAAGRFELECVRVLLNHGADVNFQKENGLKTTVLGAAFEYLTEVICYSYEDPEPEYFYSIIKVLLQYGADINNCNAIKPPLYSLAEHPNVELMKLCLEYNADPMLKWSRLGNLPAGTYRDYDMDPLDEFYALQFFLYLTSAMLDEGFIQIKKVTRLFLHSMPNVSFLFANNWSTHPRNRKIYNLLRKEQIDEIIKPMNEDDTEYLIKLTPVFSLKHITRYCIRKQLGCCHVPTIVQQLSLPQDLRDYLTII